MGKGPPGGGTGERWNLSRIGRREESGARGWGPGAQGLREDVWEGSEGAVSTTWVLLQLSLGVWLWGLWSPVLSRFQA